MKPPRLNPNSPDYNQQIQHHLDLIWKELEKAKGVGGRTIRLLGPLDMMGLPVLNSAPTMPVPHSGSHQNGGSDEITVVGLSGLLADSQTPHLMAAATRGGALLGDVFKLSSEVLTLATKAKYGFQRIDDGTGQEELALIKQDTLRAIATVDASDLATAITLVNELKAMVNSIIQDLKDAQILADWQGWFHQNYFHAKYWATGYFSDAT